MKKNINKKEKGFTLVETLVAIFILTLAISGPIYISSFALRNTIDSRDSISAQYLAEEVIEVIRNRRDSRELQSSDSSKWLQTDKVQSITDLAYCFNIKGSPITNKCLMARDNVMTDGSVDNYEFSDCSADCNDDIDHIPFDPNSTYAFYGGSDASDTSKFIRDFYFESSSDIIPNDEVNLVVEIRWLQKGQPKIYTLTERLYNINYNTVLTK
jgi:prepilin-type N-terminal cleavage/methylation domain-containing protein